MRFYTGREHLSQNIILPRLKVMIFFRSPQRHLYREQSGELDYVFQKESSSTFSPLVRNLRLLNAAHAQLQFWTWKNLANWRMCPQCSSLSVIFCVFSLWVRACVFVSRHATYSQPKCAFASQKHGVRDFSTFQLCIRL